jgi:hypothetical protein
LTHQNRQTKQNFKTMNTTTTSAANEPKDEFLMKIAQKRVGFQKHAIVYLIVCTVISILCLVSGGPVPFSLWVGWGIGLGFHGLGAYLYFDERAAAEREYERLLKEKR